eukprot:scaffold719_cov117-Cylindrotheca_fusiformis.AAC.7
MDMESRSNTFDHILKALTGVVQRNLLLAIFNRGTCWKRCDAMLTSLCFVEPIILRGVSISVPILSFCSSCEINLSGMVELSDAESRSSFAFNNHHGGVVTFNGQHQVALVCCI